MLLLILFISPLLPEALIALVIFCSAIGMNIGAWNLEKFIQTESTLNLFNIGKHMESKREYICWRWKVQVLLPSAKIS